MRQPLEFGDLGREVTGEGGPSGRRDDGGLERGSDSHWTTSEGAYGGRAERGRPQAWERGPGEHQPSGEGRRSEKLQGKGRRTWHPKGDARRAARMTAGVRGVLAAGAGGSSHRALGVDAAQMGLEAAHAPAAVAAQLQVAVALVGALHQERDGLGLHVDGAVGSAALPDARQEVSLPTRTPTKTLRLPGSRARPSRAPFIGTPRPDSADRTLCGCHPLAGAESTAPTWPNRRPAPWAEGRAEHVGAD